MPARPDLSAIRLRLANRQVIPIALAALAYGLALAQHPGANTADTKVDLHVDPLRFLGQISSVWSPTQSLGHVQGGQYSGYLWPMGPFFAVGHLAGIPPALVERLWLGTLLALASWGAVRLLDTLLDRRRGIAHVVAGAAYMVNPYVIVFTSRTTVFLLAYAALPWLLVIVYRGVRQPRSWWWAVAFALVTTSTGGGVNATVTAMILVGPVLLALYEMALRSVPPRALVAFGWRTLLATGAASVWWTMPLLVQSRFGLNFLQFTEQVGSIWGPTSLTESLRLMGYWPSYLGVGYVDKLSPYFGDSGTLLFNAAVVVASLLIPALALGSYVWTRRWRYAPFLLGSALVTLLVMSVGYPDGTPGRRAATFLYNHLSALQFLRTTYKAGPLLALAVALLGGAAARRVWQRGARPRVLLVPAAAALLVFSALPMFEGRALELTWKSIPAAWSGAGRDLNAQLPANSRVVVLPGQAFAFYTWGGTVDPILPALTNRPVAIRNVPPYDDLHAVDYMWTVDDLVQQQRLLPGELPPLLDLMSARSVITATDDDTARSGSLTPAPAAQELVRQPGFSRPTRSYGPVRRFAAPSGTADPGLDLPQVRRYDLPARGLLRVEPASLATILDGDAQGVADSSAVGALASARPLFYAGDLTSRAMQGLAQAGANVLITDSNRRRAFVASRTRQNVGWTIAATEPFSPDAAVLDPFPGAGSAAQTVATFRGARYVRAPYDPELAQFPEHAPVAAFDGDPRTSWLADPTLDESRHWVEVGLDQPRPVPYVDVLEDQSDPLVQITQVTVDGERFRLHRGWNHLPVALPRVSAVRVTITGVHSVGANTGSSGGLAEVRIPGVSIHELLRPPVLAEQALRGTSLVHSSLTYVFERTTADQPLQRGPAPQTSITHGDRLQAEAALVRLAQDAESGIARTFDPPAARTWTLSGLATPAPAASDATLDRLAGTRTGGASWESSGRLQGRPGRRASAAFDGSRETAWVAPFGPQQPAWIAWRTSHPNVLRGLTLVPSTLPARFPTMVSIAGDGGRATALPVGGGGTIKLPSPLRARSFRLTILRAGGSPSPVVAVAEISGAGVPHATPAAAGAAVRSRCGDLRATIGARVVPLRLTGSVASLDGGAPLGLSSCGGPVRVAAASSDLTVPGTFLRPLLLSLHSPAPAPLAHLAGGTGAVTDPGHQGRGRYTGARVDVHAPSWLVLGESYNRGWEAHCDGRSLGAPSVIDGFANGWPIDRSCRSLTVSFAPQRDVSAGLVVGGALCALLLLVLLLRRPRRVTPAREPDLLPTAPAWVSAADVRSAVTVGVLSAAVFGFAFGLRAGVVVGPAYALILWRGVCTRRLAGGAFALLVLVVPVIYLVTLGHDLGGYDTGFATQHLAAHWVAVGAFALLALVLARDLVTLRRLSKATGREPDDRAARPDRAASTPARA